MSGVRIRTLLWFCVLAVPLLALLPWGIARAGHAAGWAATPGQWLGAWLIANGAGLALWCVNLFNVRGEGTPVPFDPPKRFVVAGPYRFVRNPMMWSVFLMLWGQALAYRSAGVAGYALLITLAAVSFVRWFEEPQLVRRFGAPYEAYRRAVPRWLPRPRPWVPPTDLP